METGATSADVCEQVDVEGWAGPPHRPRPFKIGILLNIGDRCCLPPLRNHNSRHEVVRNYVLTWVLGAQAWLKLAPPHWLRPSRACVSLSQHT